jgi:hypothetical protein
MMVSHADVCRLFGRSFGRLFRGDSFMKGLRCHA